MSVWDYFKPVVKPTPIVGVKPSVQPTAPVVATQSGSTPVSSSSSSSSKPSNSGGSSSSSRATPSVPTPVPYHSDLLQQSFVDENVGKKEEQAFLSGGVYDITTGKYTTKSGKIVDLDKSSVPSDASVVKSGGAKIVLPDSNAPPTRTVVEPIYDTVLDSGKYASHVEEKKKVFDVESEKRSELARQELGRQQEVERKRTVVKEKTIRSAEVDTKSVFVEPARTRRQASYERRQKVLREREQEKLEKDFSERKEKFLRDVEADKSQFMSRQKVGERVTTYGVEPIALSREAEDYLYFAGQGKSVYQVSPQDLAPVAVYSSDLLERSYVNKEQMLADEQEFLKQGSSKQEKSLSEQLGINLTQPIIGTQLSTHKKLVSQPESTIIFTPKEIESQYYKGGISDEQVKKATSAFETVVDEFGKPLGRNKVSAKLSTITNVIKETTDVFHPLKEKMPLVALAKSPVFVAGVAGETFGGLLTGVASVTELAGEGTIAYYGGTKTLAKAVEKTVTAPIFWGREIGKVGMSEVATGFSGTKKVLGDIGLGITEELGTDPARFGVKLVASAGYFKAGVGGAKRVVEDIKYLGKTFVPIEDLVPKEVLAGKTAFPRVYGEPKDLLKIYKEDAYFKAMSAEKGVYHATDWGFYPWETTLEVSPGRGLVKYADVPGMYTSLKGTSTYFLRTEATVPKYSLLPKLPEVGKGGLFRLLFSKPKIFFIEENPQLIPTAFTGSLQESQKFFGKVGTTLVEPLGEKGVPYVSPAFAFKFKSEAEAVIQVGSKFAKKPVMEYTVFGGQKIPIQRLELIGASPIKSTGVIAKASEKVLGVGGRTGLYDASSYVVPSSVVKPIISPSLIAGVVSSSKLGKVSESLVTPEVLSVSPSLIAGVVSSSKLGKVSESLVTPEVSSNKIVSKTVESKIAPSKNSFAVPKISKKPVILSSSSSSFKKIVEPRYNLPSYGGTKAVSTPSFVAYPPKLFFPSSSAGYVSSKKPSEYLKKLGKEKYLGFGYTAGKKEPVFRLKSDSFRKFAFSEKDLLVSKKSLKLRNVLWKRQGSFSAFVPTKELLKKNKGEEAWLKRVGFNSRTMSLGL